MDQCKFYMRDMLSKITKNHFLLYLVYNLHCVNVSFLHNIAIFKKWYIACHNLVVKLLIWYPILSGQP